MSRHQQGSVYEASGAFFVRFYVTETLNGHAKRVQRSQRLCQKDGNKYRSVNDKNVKLLRDKIMLSINEQNASGRVNSNSTTVADFWEKQYVPFITENRRASTVHGYQKVWKQHLKSHFGQMTLTEYRTYIGSKLLTSLAGPPSHLGRATLAHIRSLASAIFTHALNLGLIESNPFHDVKVLGKVKEPKGNAHYTLKQATQMISGLVGHPDAQAVLALACFLGLRPGEIAGLRWEDIDTEGKSRWIHIRRAVVRGVIGETKTRIKAAQDQTCSCGMPLSQCQRLPLIEPVAIGLDLWRKGSGNPSQGWVFPNRMGKPTDLAVLARSVIRPILSSKNITFKGLYPGRRGAATILTELTGSAIAAQQLLRHQDLNVTTKSYIQMMPDALLGSVKLLEKSITAAFDAGAE